MRGGRTSLVLASATALLALITSSAALASRQGPETKTWPADLVEAAAGSSGRHDRFLSEPYPPVDLTFYLHDDAPSQAQRIIDTTHRALRLFSEWFGPYPDSALSVVDVSWPSDEAGAAYPGVVATRTHWLATDRDLTADRSLIAAIARQYWTPATPQPTSRWFEEGLILYSSTRGIHEALEGRNFATLRFFGGNLPFVLRSIIWSPNLAQARPRIRHFTEVDEPVNAPWRASTTEVGGAAQQTALALHTLERYLGWPALQQALFAMRERSNGRGVSPELLSAVLAEQRGVDLAWFFSEALRSGARFDYGVDAISTEPVAGAAERFRTVVSVRRYGDGIFAGTSRPRDGDLTSSGSLAVSVVFEDGAEAVDYWDGREARRDFFYESRSRAVSATIDPELMLLLDADRTNNSRSLQAGRDQIGMRLAMHWLVWLQDLMLTYSAVA